MRSSTLSPIKGGTGVLKTIMAYALTVKRFTVTFLFAAIVDTNGTSNSITLGRLEPYHLAGSTCFKGLSWQQGLGTNERRIESEARVATIVCIVGKPHPHIFLSFVEKGSWDFIERTDVIIFILAIIMRFGLPPWTHPIRGRDFTPKKSMWRYYVRFTSRLKMHDCLVNPDKQLSSDNYLPKVSFGKTLELVLVHLNPNEEI